VVCYYADRWGSDGFHDEARSVVVPIWFLTTENDVAQWNAPLVDG
jgi:hypothetical protein